ncbi:MAG: FISUMP domain-containing protein [Bacteroidales bacterium]
MKTRIGFYLHQALIIVGLFLVFACSCKKEDDIRIPVLSTSEVTNILQLSAQSGGIITSDEGFVVSARGVCWSLNVNPTIADNKTSDGTGAGSFTSEITGLTADTTYYVRAYATNSKGTGYGSTMVFKTMGNTFTDPRDGNVYKIVTIGSQIWMAENLRYLPGVASSSSGSNTNTRYYVYDYNGMNVSVAKATTNYQTYGVLYNWPAAMAGASSSSSNPSGVQGICPVGWHLPSDAEWTQLTDYLGGPSLAGGKLKEDGTIHWSSPNTGATNESGFAALPGGSRVYTGEFNYIGSNGFWWSATESTTDNAGIRSMRHNTSSVSRSFYIKEWGFSVCCVRD